MKFSAYQFDARVKQSLEELGFRKPTDIQFKSIPNILKGEDLLAVAQTGTGKTAAFAIPMIDMIFSAKRYRKGKGGVKGLVMVPTHELANQIEQVFQSIAKYTDIKTVALIGGVEQAPQIEQLTQGVDIVIATPGRMFDLIHQGFLKTDQIEILVLDEADYMLDLGFKKDISDILFKLPKRRQTLFFSATINDKIKKTAFQIVKQNAIRIQISPKDPVAKNIDHFVLYVEMDDKRFFLERVVNENPSAKILVFVRTKVRAERVSKAMERVGISSLTIHGDKDQEERTRVLKQFREGDIQLLIGTDVTARGIDIPDISIVINYDLPEEAENYVHRVGRTGRAKRKGHAYSFCAPEERIVLEEIQGFLEQEIAVLKMDKLEYKNTLNINREKTYDYMSIIEDINEFESSKKKKKEKKK
jgi:ATP-dependent RNA helicase RhlE